MSGSGADSGNGQSQDFDLNIAPIIDCFTVLIAFMLVSATYLSIQILDAGITAPGEQSAATDQKPPSVNVTVTLQPDHTIEVEVTGKVKETLRSPASDGKWDYVSLERQIGSLRERFSDLTSATLAAHSDVEYRDVVETMQVVRKSVPYVMLGGF